MRHIGASTVSKQAGKPFRENCSSLNDLSSGFALHEAAVPDADVVDKTSGAEKDDLAVLIDDRTVTGLSPHHSSLQSDATTRHPFARTSSFYNTFALILLHFGPVSLRLVALLRHPDRHDECPHSRAEQKTYARTEFFSV
jgi:hypothetical protein